MNYPPVAIIGAGYWGKNLVRNFYHLGSLKIVCDKEEFNLKHIKEKYPEIEVTFSYSDILNNPEIQGIVIATPAELHYRHVKEAILARKDVFVEKPLALTLEEAKELCMLAKEQKRILMVGHLLQYHPVFKRLKKIIASGELGRINYIYSHRLNLGKIRREENILWSFAPHDISMILSLAGEMPQEVWAIGGNYLHQEIADVTTTHFSFASGLKAHIFVSWLHPFKEQKLVVVGDKKMAVFNDTAPWEQKLLLYSHAIEWLNGIPTPKKAEPEAIIVPKAEPLQEECKHFLECLTERKKPLTDGEEGLRVLTILSAAQEALEGRRVVFLRGRREQYFVHPSAIIDEGVEIGAGTKIWHFSHILTGTKIGENCIIGQNCMIGPDVKIGNRCKIQNNVSIYKGVEIEDEVFCGPSMVFTNVLTPRAFIERKHEFQKTLVKRGATIGANATIICGNTIGCYAMIGAGALVTKNVPDYALYLGVPAELKGWVCKCGTVLTKKTRVSTEEIFVCKNCGSKYILKGSKFSPIREEI